MNTPICDFVQRYAESGALRAHMPGHKGAYGLGFEKLDITEIDGADALCEASGIIAESEANAASLFGTRATFYATEGSSQCIRAMLFLALRHTPRGTHRPFCIAGRNAHKAFLYAAALCDFDVNWLDPPSSSVCACPIRAGDVETALRKTDETPFCVYITSPDYLGGCVDIGAIAEVCHAHRIPLLVDNAHGAYLKFLPGQRHPMDAGADLCCDSAHKTLPVLTGGAYLHVSKAACPCFVEEARHALGLFGSTSPSYLILQSLDWANHILSEDYPSGLIRCCERVEALGKALAARGYALAGQEPTKLVLTTDGLKMAQILSERNIHVEFADSGHLVMMFSPANPVEDYVRIEEALPAVAPVFLERTPIKRTPARRAMTIREAIFAASETIPVENALGRICAAPCVSCPPAVPIAISGEILDEVRIAQFREYGLSKVSVVKENVHA